MIKSLKLYILRKNNISGKTRYLVISHKKDRLILTYKKLVVEGRESVGEGGWKPLVVI